MSAVLALGIGMPSGAMHAIAEEVGAPPGTGEIYGKDAPALQPNSDSIVAGHDARENATASDAENARESDGRPDSADENSEVVVANSAEQGNEPHASPSSDEASPTMSEPATDATVDSKADATRAGPLAYSDSNGAMAKGSDGEAHAASPNSDALSPALETQADPVQVEAAVTHFEIQYLDHSTATQMYYTDTFYLAMSWDASANGANIHEGDFFTIQLPDNMRFPSDTTARDFDVQDSEGNVIARAHVAPGENDAGGTVTLTFTNQVEGKYNVKGSLYLAARFDTTQVSLDEPNTFTITVNGEVGGEPQAIGVGIVVNGPSNPVNEVLSKWGGKVDDNPNQAYWHVRINHMGMSLSNVVITDTLGDSGETFVPGTFLLRKVVYRESGAIQEVLETVDTSDILQLADGGTSFVLTLGNVGQDQYHLEYKSTYTPGTRLRNRLRIAADEGQHQVVAAHQSAESGGSGGGDLASKIKITKVAADDATVLLAGATFEVTAPDGSTFELTTGADGTVTSDHLVPGTYAVREVVAPAGYEPNPETFSLEVTATGAALLTVADVPERVSVPVTKRWVGPTGGAVVVHLLADGADTGAELTLSERSGWMGEFEELRKYDAADGHEIAYSVREDATDSYASEITGSMSEGFVVTNTSTETVDVWGTKVWDDDDDRDGIRPEHVTVALLADGAELLSKEVGADDDWSFAFDALPKYDPIDGHEVSYAVQEKPVDGYASVTSGDATLGFTVTNVHEPETIDVPVIKKWVGTAAETVTIWLYADGERVGEPLVLDADNGWAGAFEGLPKYRDHGIEIAYSISEDELAGYDSEVSGNAGDGFTVTNTEQKTPPEKQTPPERPAPPTPPAPPKRPTPKWPQTARDLRVSRRERTSLAKTGDDSDVMGAGAIAIVALVTVCGAIALRLRRREQ